jgi:hypothetical protein
MTDRMARLAIRALKIMAVLMVFAWLVSRFVRI